MCQISTQSHSDDRQGISTWLVAALFIFGFRGYTLFLMILFSVGLGATTRPFSVAYRAIFLGLCQVIIGILLSNRMLRFNGFTWLLALFWSLYAFRILADGFLAPVSLRLPPREYVIRAFGMTAIPMLAFSGIIRPRQYKAAFLGFLLPLFAFCALAAVFYSNYIGTSYRTLSYSGVDESALLDGLAISHSGALLVLVAVWPLTVGSNKTLFCVTAIVFGGACIFLGASRGAIVALGAGLAFIATYTTTRSRLRTITIAVGVSLAMFFATFTVVGEAMFGRYEILIEKTQSREEDAGGGRLGIWQRSLQTYLDNPLTGGGLEDPVMETYPHNHILEAFMATGTLGGCAFVLLCVLGFRNAIRVMTVNPELGWISVTFVYCFTAGMLSGAVTTSMFWYSLIAVEAAARPRSIE